MVSVYVHLERKQQSIFNSAAIGAQPIPEHWRPKMLFMFESDKIIA
jgi:hypothetical protein